MKRIPQIRVRTRHNMFSALSAAALGCSLAYWIASKQRSRTASSGENRAAADSPAPASGQETMPDPEDLGDDLIAELVSSEIALSCSTPGSVTVICVDGIVTLQGKLLKDEIHRVLRSVSRIPGIQEIHDHLEARRAPIAITNRRPVRRMPALETSSPEV